MRYYVINQPYGHYYPIGSIVDTQYTDAFEDADKIPCDGRALDDVIISQELRCLLEKNGWDRIPDLRELKPRGEIFFGEINDNSS
jgi:hypothetical protein